MSKADTSPAKKWRKPLPKNRLRPADTQRFVEKLVGDDFHAMRVLSLANGLTGTIHGATLGIHAIGQGLAQAQALNPKHAVKQVDRLLSNSGIVLDDFFKNWVPFVVGAREDVQVA